MSQFEKAMLWIIKIGLWLVPLLPLYVSGSMLFPFITGKNFAFRIITEIIFALWVGLAISRPEYRPKLTPLFKIATAFVGIVFLADLLSPNPYRAFFSNYERMEGFMMLGHMYIYFLMLASVFKERRDWLVFFHASLAASLIASYYGLLQRFGYRVSLQGGFRVDSTIGNPTYFAAYLMMHVWLLGILIYQYWKTWWRAAIYGALLVFESVIIYFTATRGVVLALALAAPLFLAALVYFWNKIAAPIPTGRSAGRKIAAGILALSVAIPLLFWGVRQTGFVQSSQALKRLTNYSIREGTIQDRLLIWKMSLKGVLERPILGWGQENYYLVFQKYYEPGLYGAEPWFDRSHNVFLDWAVHAGILGLGAYLGIIATALWQLVRAMREKRHAFFEGLILIGLFATDFFQKLFVFDNFNSYLLFFAALAYTQYVSAPESAKSEARTREKSGNLMAYGAGGAASLFVAVGIWGWWAHVKPIRQSQDLIRTLQLVRSQGSADAVTAAFNQTLAHNSFGTTEVREQLGNLGREVAFRAEGTPEERKKFIEFALGELRKETGHSASDVKHLLFRATILNRVLGLDPAYVAEAEAVTGEAIRLSPTKQPVYFERAQFLLALNRLDEAAEALARAWRLEKNFKPAAANLWTIAIFAKRNDLVEEVKRPSLLADLDEAAVFAIARAYQQVEDFPSARDTYAALVKAYPANPAYRATYAALLARTGNAAEARIQAAEAIRLDPSYEKEAKQFLHTVR